MLNIEFRSRIAADESGRDRVIVVVNGVEDERSFCLVGESRHCTCVEYPLDRPNRQPWSFTG